MDVSEEIM